MVVIKIGDQTSEELQILSQMLKLFAADFIDLTENLEDIGPTMYFSLSM